MYAIFEAFDSLNDFMSAGGMVLWLIAFLALFMWALILERIWYFNSGHKEFMKPLVKQWNGISDHSSWKASQIKDKLRSEAKEEIKQAYVFDSNMRCSSSTIWIAWNRDRND